MKKLLIASVVAAALSSSAYAGVNMTAPSSSTTMSHSSSSMMSSYAGVNTELSGVYVGAQAGYGMMDGAKKFTGENLKRNHFVWGVNAGYRYGLTQNFLLGAQLGYVDGFKADYTGAATATFKQYQVNLLATGTYLMGDGFNAFVNAGVAYVKLDGSGAAPGNDHAYKPVAGLGVGYVYQDINFYAEYDHLFGGSNGTSSNAKVSKSDAFYAGVSYTLPM